MTILNQVRHWLSRLEDDIQYIWPLLEDAKLLSSTVTVTKELLEKYAKQLNASPVLSDRLNELKHKVAEIPFKHNFDTLAKCVRTAYLAFLPKSQPTWKELLAKRSFEKAYAKANQLHAFFEREAALKEVVAAYWKDCPFLPLGHPVRINMFLTVFDNYQACEPYLNALLTEVINEGAFDTALDILVRFPKLPQIESIQSFPRQSLYNAFVRLLQAEKFTEILILLYKLSSDYPLIKYKQSKELPEKTAATFTVEICKYFLVSKLGVTTLTPAIYLIKNKTNAAFRKSISKSIQNIQSNQKKLDSRKAPIAYSRIAHALNSQAANLFSSRFHHCIKLIAASNDFSSDCERMVACIQAALDEMPLAQLELVADATTAMCALLKQKSLAGNREAKAKAQHIQSLVSAYEE